VIVRIESESVSDTDFLCFVGVKINLKVRVNGVAVTFVLHLGHDGSFYVAG
jgi:hypothetical protein